MSCGIPNGNWVNGVDSFESASALAASVFGVFVVLRCSRMVYGDPGFTLCDEALLSWGVPECVFAGYGLVCGAVADDDTI